VKELFRGYYKLTEEEIDKAWSTGFISLDTNVLCNLYRYSEETRVELLKAIGSYSGQLWLPYHVASEFHRNRPDVIGEQIKTYDATIAGMKKMEDDIVKNLKTPHLSPEVVGKFKDVIDACIKDLTEKKEFYLGLLQHDTILAEISDLFDEKVGDSFTAEDLSTLEKDGEQRYKKEIPPGYKDANKNENKFGDLIIWKQLITKSNKDNLPFIFIMDDLKDDWWLRVQGKTISPRPELLQELYGETKQVFHLYDSHRFLQFAAKTTKVKQAAIDEVKEITTEKKRFVSVNHDNFYENYKSIYPEILEEALKTNTKLSSITGLSPTILKVMQQIKEENELMRTNPSYQQIKNIFESSAYKRYMDNFIYKKEDSPEKSDESSRRDESDNNASNDSDVN